jgi:hypothetical protein
MRNMVVEKNFHCRCTPITGYYSTVTSCVILAVKNKLT